MGRTQRVHPANLRPGDTLCGDDGQPFADVDDWPYVDGHGDVWVPLPMCPVRFRPGERALRLAHTIQKG